MKSYSEKLKHPKWQKKRLKVLKRDEFRCQICWDSETTLHVHHKYYVKGRDPWRYHLKAFLTLCEKCHEIIHPKKKQIQTENDNYKPEIMTPKEEEKAMKARKEFFTKRKEW